MSARVIVCGDRKYGRDDLPGMTQEEKRAARRDRGMLIEVLDGFYTSTTMGHLTLELSTFTLIEGDAAGADSIAHWWGKNSPMHSHNERPDDPLFEHFCFPAEWDTYGKSAGPIRNRKQLAKLLEGPAEVERRVFAFHNDLQNSKGTKDMVGIAHKADVPVYLFSRLR